VKKQNENELDDLENAILKKQLHMMRNDLYYKRIDARSTFLIDLLYHPISTVGSDAYSIRVPKQNKILYLLIDAERSGIVSSLTTISLVCGINYIIDTLVKNKSFSLDLLLQKVVELIGTVLLDEESVSMGVVLLDTKTLHMEYANFALPPFLLEDDAGDVVKLPANNPSLDRRTKKYSIDNVDVKKKYKFFFCTDGIFKSETKEGSPYESGIEDDFANSFTKEELKERILGKFSLEDDFTFILVTKIELDEKTLLYEREFETSLSVVDEANEWYRKMCGSKCSDVAFNELFMNAYEHGNLGIGSEEKHELLQNDLYFERLLTLEKQCDKKIIVRIYKITTKTSQYFVTQIEDEGKGFDTGILSGIFRNVKKFNGRGVFVSKNNSMGIYYNSKGNSVLFLSRV